MARSPSETAPGTRLIERAAGETASLVLRKARLVVAEGPDRGRALAVERTRVRIGTDPTNDLVLGDDAVSTRHVEIAATGDPSGVDFRGAGSQAEPLYWSQASPPVLCCGVPHPPI